MTHPKKIRATYKNGVIEPLDKLNLPEGQELELEFKVLPSTSSALSKEQKKRPNSENARFNERHLGKYRQRN